MIFLAQCHHVELFSKFCQSNLCISHDYLENGWNFIVLQLTLLLFRKVVGFASWKSFSVCHVSEFFGLGRGHESVVIKELFTKADNLDSTK